MNGLQSVLDPAGAGGAGVAALWWIMFGLGTAVFVAVVVALGFAFIRRRKEAAGPRAAVDRTLQRAVGTALGLTLVILLATFVLSIRTSRGTAGLAVAGAPEIEITGVQWWWDVRYLQDDGPGLRAANELHLPAGRSVRIKLRSRDVIHSFWVPSLHGKMDLVPGRENELWIRADKPGTYRGQCAEFCGLQHARMAIVVVVHEPEQYDAWLAAQQMPATPSTDSLAVAGARAFERLPCASCHAIRGTDARGEAGPDLTHFASRRSIGAGTMENTPGNLGAWLTDPQTFKPGNHMPRVPLAPDDLVALVAYMETLR